MQNKQNDLALSWLKNSIIALAIAGIYSIILVALRVPQISVLFADKSIFKSALVVHVNLSVLVWLLSITCVIWTYNSFRTGVEQMLAMLAFIAMILMALSPFLGDSVPVMNNYIPMLENIWFVISLSLFGVVILGFAILTLISSILEFKRSCDLLLVVRFTTSLMFIIVWVCFILSFFALYRLSSIVTLDMEFYYEMLYWSGGHLLQFIYTQMLMFVWLILFEGATGRKLALEKVYTSLLWINFTLSLFVLYGHFAFDVEDGAFKEFFTAHMKYAGGIAPSIFIVLLCFEAMNKKHINAPHVFLSAIIASSALFLSGGLIGLFISGVNVTIPAHYHGAIVGITIAFMGFVYVYCYHEPASDNKNINKLLSSVQISAKYQALASWQIYIIAIGQILHISGLALAGGYGVLRKNPGDAIALSVKIYMGIMGIGGFIAIIGGLMFVYICAKNLYSFKNLSNV